MDGNTVKLVCPSCAATATASVHAQGSACPRCGCPLSAEDAGPCAADGSLIADLREAFEFDADALAAAGPCRLGSPGGASDVFSNSLAAEAFPAGSRLDDFEILGEFDSRNGADEYGRCLAVEYKLEGRDTKLSLFQRIRFYPKEEEAGN